MCLSTSSAVQVRGFVLFVLSFQVDITVDLYSQTQ